MSKQHFVSCLHCGCNNRLISPAVEGDVFYCVSCNKKFIVPAQSKATERNGSPDFYNLLEEMADTHSRKSHDYANDNNPFGNYHFAGQIALLFAHSHKDAGFVGRLAEKIYRLANLESSSKTPSNESIEDTERDIAVITVLWMASRRAARGQATDISKSFVDSVEKSRNAPQT